MQAAAARAGAGADETHWPFTAPRLRLQQQASTARETTSQIRIPPYLVLTGRATSVRQIRRLLLGSAAAIGGQHKRIGDWDVPCMYIQTDSTTTTWQYFFSRSTEFAGQRGRGDLACSTLCSAALPACITAPPPLLSFFLPLLRCPSLCSNRDHHHLPAELLQPRIHLTSRCQFSIVPPLSPPPSPAVII